MYGIQFICSSSFLSPLTQALSKEAIVNIGYCDYHLVTNIGYCDYFLHHFSAYTLTVCITL